MLKSDVENASELAQLLFDLTQDEGNSVEIHHPNPDFGGPNSIVSVTADFNVDHPTHYEGDSVLDCLQQAKAAHDIMES